MLRTSDIIVEEYALCVRISYDVLDTHTKSFVHVHTVCIVVIMQGLRLLIIVAQVHRKKKRLVLKYFGPRFKENLSCAALHFLQQE